MLKQQLLLDLKKAVEELGFKGSDIVVSIPQNSTFGDYSTNIALQLAKQLSVTSHQSSVEIANKILEKLRSLSYLSHLEVKDPGFINFFIKESSLVESLGKIGKISTVGNIQKILVEYGHANILKEVHIGHLRTFILGESLSRILSSVGHEVFRANYQGDIGLHVAKALWGVKKLRLPSGTLSLKEKASFLGKAYAEGNRFYEEDPTIKQEINEINTALYQKDSAWDDLYKTTRQWSIEYFEAIYNILGIKYDRCFFESEVHGMGKDLVLKNVDKVFEKSDGAVIFRGEKYGLHNRVFINSAGNPTYEAKDIGLGELEYEAFSYDKSVHVVGSEQSAYFQVVFKALEFIFPNLKDKKYHLSYGMVGLKEGKMSSRMGNVVTIDDLMDEVVGKVREIISSNKLEIDEEVIQKIAVGAIKFTYLKFAPQSNIVFDVTQSVSLQGDSGPYIQYTYARSRSILRGADGNLESSITSVPQLEKEERDLLLKLDYFSSVIEQAAQEYRPNILCLYLIELSGAFNLFYQKHRVLQSDKKEFRLALTLAVSQTLKKGLELLGIEAPERM